MCTHQRIVVLPSCLILSSVHLSLVCVPHVHVALDLGNGEWKGVGCPPPPLLVPGLGKGAGGPWFGRTQSLQCWGRSRRCQKAPVPRSSLAGHSPSCLLPSLPPSPSPTLHPDPTMGPSLGLQQQQQHAQEQGGQQSLGRHDSARAGSSETGTDFPRELV